MAGGSLKMKLFKEICRKIYLTGKYYDLELNAKLKKSYPAIVGTDTRIEDDAFIQNSTNQVSRIKIGNNCHIRGHSMVLKHGGQIEIGDHCFVGPETKIWSSASIKIGNRV